jgi:benzoate membrane transport protein
MEPGPGLKEGWQDVKFNVPNVTAFITGVIFTLTGAIILFVNVAASANLNQQQAASWIISGVVLAAISSGLLCLYYKQPIIIAPSLPALLVVGPMFKLFSVPEMVAGYLIAAAIIFLIGAAGVVGLLGKYLPVPIIMGMIAGVFMSYGLRIVEAVAKEPVVTGLTIAAFLITPLVSKRIPPQAVSLVVAMILSFLLLPLTMEVQNMYFHFAQPVFVVPRFNYRVILAVSIPLVLMGLADTLKGYGVLRANEYDPPLNTITSVAGLASFLGAFSLSHCIVLAGPVTAIVGGASAGEKEHRYAAGLLFSAALILIGITLGVIMPFLTVLPAAISNVVAGLAMLGLFTSSLEMAFGANKHQLGAFTAFIVGMSNVTVGGIGAPVWAILFGILVSAVSAHKRA